MDDIVGGDKEVAARFVTETSNPQQSADEADK